MADSATMAMANMSTRNGTRNAMQVKKKRRLLTQAFLNNERIKREQYKEREIKGNLLKSLVERIA